MIKHLKARGFIGINRGTGLDEIEIDFAGREGIVAFSGKNGTSKSSVIDLLHPYDCLPSREGVLKNHVYLRDSLIDLTFTHMGRHYRKEIKIDAQSGKSEGKIFIDGSDTSATTGAISEYKKWATQTFGSEELFFASNFKAQGATDVSKMAPGKLKALFAEFLRLDRYEAWADTAKQRGNKLSGVLEGLDTRIATLQTMGENKPRVELEYTEAGSKAENLRDDKTLLEHALSEKRQSVDALKDIISSNALALQRRADIQGQIDRLEGELAKEKQTATAEIQVFSSKWVEIKNAITAAGAILKDREAIETAAENIRDLESGLTGLVAQIEEDNQNIPVYQKRCHDLETDLTRLRQQVKDLENDPENLRLGKIAEEAERAVKEREKEIKALDKDSQLLAIEAEIKSLERAVLVGDGIDADCKSGTCAAIKSVNEAKEKLPIAIKAAGARKTEVETDKETISIMIEEIKTKAAAVLRERALRIENIGALKFTVNAQIKATTHDLKNAQQVLLSTTELLAVHRADLPRKRAEIVKQKALADRLPEIQIAEVRKADLEKQLADVTEQGTAKKDAWYKRQSETTGTLQAMTLGMEGISIDISADAELVAAQAEIKEIETAKIPKIEKEIQGARDKIATIYADIRRIEAAEKELTTVRAERETLTAKIGRWKYLQIGCGQNGLQALEIDGATPAINDRANKLLYQGYGQEFTIKVVTQDERGKECLDILVISEHGEELLSLKSGGEKVWLLQPIRLAMALLNREKSGREFDMAFFDESDGALDAEGSAQHYMELYRPFMEMGGIKQCVIITHKPECLAYADHVLQFRAGEGPRWG